MGNPLKILHIEGLAADADLVGKELKKQNIVFSQLVVDNEKDFIKSLKEFSPDIILSDYCVSSFNSSQAVKVLRENGSTVPFILVAGIDSEESAADMMKQGISDYILKNNLHRLPSSIIKAFEIRELQVEKENAEKDILQMNRELRDLSAHLQIVREEERASISRELHDELGQQLARLKMDIIWINSKISKEDEKIRERLTGSVALIDDTVETMRRINTALRPKILDDLGLFAAIEWQASDFTKHTGVLCKLKIDLTEPEFSKLLPIHIFRIHQEALTNIAKYAHATDVKTELKLQDGKMVMSVQDNGIGFDTKSKNEKSFGLLGMKERAGIIGGEIRIQSDPGTGTLVELSVPINKS